MSVLNWVKALGKKIEEYKQVEGNIEIIEMDELHTYRLAKNRLTKFKGIHQSTIYLPLKECEFRFNYRNENLYKKLLTIVNILSLSCLDPEIYSCLLFF